LIFFDQLPSTISGMKFTEMLMQGRTFLWRVFIYVYCMAKIQILIC